MDEIREDSAGKAKIGTTRRGIGPAYEDKIGRRSIRVMDLISEKNLSHRLETVLIHHNAIRKGLNKKIYEKDELKRALLKIAPEILKFAQPVWLKLDQFNNDRKKILFEGAQGILLDVDHGTYPYVTSSNTVPAMAATGSGSGWIQFGIPQDIWQLRWGMVHRASYIGHAHPSSCKCLTQPRTHMASAAHF